MVLTPHVTRASTLYTAFQGRLLGLAVADVAGNAVALRPSGDVDTLTHWLLSQGKWLAGPGVTDVAGIVIVGPRRSVRQQRGRGDISDVEPCLRRIDGWGWGWKDAWNVGDMEGVVRKEEDEGMQVGNATSNNQCSTQWSFEVVGANYFFGVTNYVKVHPTTSQIT
ncbi:hypothetical protein BJ165DRAFT_1411214 [Panaeolus papilionaceus]|nr:hypothetical protein BJ165DRAFT_1411214 [Panaeolus papilionaceus]